MNKEKRHLTIVVQEPVMDVELPEHNGGQHTSNVPEDLAMYVRGIRDMIAHSNDVTDQAKREEICARHLSFMEAHGLVHKGVLDTVRHGIEFADSIDDAIYFVVHTLSEYFHVDAYELMYTDGHALASAVSTSASASASTSTLKTACVEPCSLRDTRECIQHALPDHLNVDKIKWTARRVRDDERDEQDVECALAAEKDALSRLSGAPRSDSERQMYTGGYLFESMRAFPLGKLVIDAFMKRGWSYDTASHHWYLPSLEHLMNLYNVPSAVQEVIRDSVSECAQELELAPGTAAATAPAPAPALETAAACAPVVATCDSSSSSAADVPQLAHEHEHRQDAPAPSTDSTTLRTPESNERNDWLRNLHEERLQRRRDTLGR